MGDWVVSRQNADTADTLQLREVAMATVLGRPFVKRFALCYQTVVCPACPVCPVCDVGVLWPNGCMNQDETWHTCRPHCAIDGDPAPPPPKGQSRPSFRPISVVAKWLKGSRCHVVWR